MDKHQARVPECDGGVSAIHRALLSLALSGKATRVLSTTTQPYPGQLCIEPSVASHLGQATAPRPAHYGTKYPPSTVPQQDT